MSARRSNTAVGGDLDSKESNSEPALDDGTAKAVSAEPAAADESHASYAQQPRAEAAQETKAAEPVKASTVAVGMDPLEANLLALFAGLDADDDGEVSAATLADGLVRAGATVKEAKKLCAEMAGYKQVTTKALDERERIVEQLKHIREERDQEQINAAEALRQLLQTV